MKQIFAVLVCLAFVIAASPMAQAQEESSLESVWDVFWLEAAAGAGASLVGALMGIGLGEIGLCSDDPLGCAIIGNWVGGVAGVAVVGGLYGVKGNLWLAPILGAAGGFMGITMDLLFTAISQNPPSFLIVTHVMTGLFTALGYNLWASL